MNLVEKIKKQRTKESIYELLKRISDDVTMLDIKLDTYNQNVKEFRVDKIKALENQVVDIKARKIAEIDKTIEIKTNENKVQQELIEKYADKINKLEKENKALREENVSLVEHIKSLESDRYLKVELPPEKAKTIQKLGVKRTGAGTGARKILKERNEEK